MSQPGFDEVMTALAGLSSKLAGREGTQIREHVQRLAAILGQSGPDEELRARAAGELEKLVAVLGALGGAKSGAVAQAVRGMDLAQLAGGLRAFAEYLRAPTAAKQAEVEQMVAALQGGAARPVPLDELRIDGQIEELALESARRHGLEGAAARSAAARMKRQMQTLMQQLELRAQQEASRARTATEFERLFDAVLATSSPLVGPLAAERAAIVQAFRTVDLAHMAEGLRAFAEWLSTPAPDPAAHVVALRARFAEVLGPPTTGDPARSEAERRADFERDIKAAVDEIFRSASAKPS